MDKYRRSTITALTLRKADTYMQRGLVKTHYRASFYFLRETYI